MSIENISISIDPSPLVSIIKAVIREEMQPTLYDNKEFEKKIEDLIVAFFENSYRADRLISRSIDHGELAGNIELSDLASEISYRELASEIDADEVAGRIEIDTDALSERVVENLDYKLLARELISAVMDRAIKTTPNS